MFKTLLVIFSGNAFASIMQLIRNLIIARLLTVEDYGVAATFAVTMVIIEMLTTLGLHLLIVQAEDGNKEEMQSGLQGFHLIRSMFSASILFFLSGPIAQFLGVPDLAWAYQILAIVPLMGGFIHFDVYRLQRKMNYRPFVLMSAVSTFISVLAIWPLYYIFDDYRIMLFSVLIQGFTAICISHYLAERRYSLILRKHLIKRFFIFGWPLMVDNVLLIAVFHGEKLIVVNKLGLAGFALIALGYTLTQAPTQVLSRSFTSFFAPQLSSAQKDDEKFNHITMSFFQVQIFLAAAFVIGVIALGPVLINNLLGDKYQELVPLLTWIALLQSISMLKVCAAQAAIARAKTENGMISNIVRIMALPFAWYYASTTGDLYIIIWIVTIGEILSVATAFVLLHFRARVSFKPIAMSLMLFAVLCALVAYYALSQKAAADYSWPTIAPALATLPVLLLLFLNAKELRLYLKRRAVTKYGD